MVTMAASSACICWAKADLIRTWSLELTSSTHLGIFLTWSLATSEKNQETIERMGYTYGLILGDSLKKKGIEKSLWDSQYLDEPMTGHVLASS
jgi:hypothetical protein